MKRAPFVQEQPSLPTTGGEFPTARVVREEGTVLEFNRTRKHKKGTSDAKENALYNHRITSTARSGYLPGKNNIILIRGDGKGGGARAIVAEYRSARRRKVVVRDQSTAGDPAGKSRESRPSVAS